MLCPYGDRNFVRGPEVQYYCSAKFSGHASENLRFNCQTLGPTSAETVEESTKVPRYFKLCLILTSSAGSQVFECTIPKLQRSTWPWLRIPSTKFFSSFFLHTILKKLLDNFHGRRKTLQLFIWIVQVTKVVDHRDPTSDCNCSFRITAYYGLCFLPQFWVFWVKVWFVRLLDCDCFSTGYY